MSKRVSEYQRTNRAFWDGDADEYQAAHHDDIANAAWGAFRIPDADLHVLGDLSGLAVLELGCGAAQASLALTEHAARSTGLDLSLGQLRHARANVAAAGRRMPLVCASAPATPFRAGSFDVVFCDHGAMSFCDPHVTVPEVARILRPGGLLAFSISTLLHNVCFPTDDPDAPITRKLRRPMFGALAFDWGDGTIDFQMLHSEWIHLFHAHGFVVEDLMELRPPAGSATGFEGFADLRWARRWPSEEIWKVRKR
ncbi:MAG: class I SAM-dependent methyltransferase [Acidimicrobiia bacterium]